MACLSTCKKLGNVTLSPAQQNDFAVFGTLQYSTCITCHHNTVVPLSGACGPKRQLDVRASISCVLICLGVLGAFSCHLFSGVNTPEEYLGTGSLRTMRRLPCDFACFSWMRCENVEHSRSLHKVYIK